MSGNNKTTAGPENYPWQDEALLDDALSGAGGGWGAGMMSDGLRSYVSAVGATVRSVRPRNALREATKLSLELARIALGSSDRQPDRRDKRFADPAWERNPLYRRLCQSYLSWCDAVKGSLDDRDSGDWRTHEQAHFIVEILTSALAPSNFLLSNPAALKHAYDTGGRSLLQGARHFAEDALTNGGMPRNVELSQFEIGKDVATTPGSVVMRNELLELIQYQPTTDSVLAEPTLLIPPQINKYYIMDLGEGRSFVEYANSRGVPVFVISWRNPGPEHSNWDLDTYGRACLEAVDAVCEIWGTDRINLLGICAGGLTGITVLNAMVAQGDTRVAGAAFAVTQVDFDVPSPLGAFHSRSLLQFAKNRSASGGVLPGNAMGGAFTWLRPNDLVWNYWVNNYLMGKEPPPFDILAWNADSTNMPAGLHRQFLDILEHNRLCRPNDVAVLDTPVDLSKITIDTFVVGAISDHITPWKGCYRTTQLLGGNSTFVLSNAGHTASLVNPPANPKASYFAGPRPGPDPERWKADATRISGSWWESWADWVGNRSPETRAAPSTLGSKRYPVIEPAPGTYVHRQPS